MKISSGKCKENKFEILSAKTAISPPLSSEKRNFEKTYTDIKELNAEIIRTFIEKVYVYGNEKPWDRNTKKIKVIFNFIEEIHIQV